MRENLQQLRNIDWEFSDYRGIRSFPSDINALHWYPAPFVPQIPAILIQALTEKADTVFDPFAGAGTALVEAARLGRKFVGIDINPYAVNIAKAKFCAISIANKRWFSTIKEDFKTVHNLDCSIEDYCVRFGVDKEVLEWFDAKTLRELCTIHHYVTLQSETRDKLLKRVLFSSILQRCCSQREHYTYVTDGCFPKRLEYRNAFDFFLKQAKLTAMAAEAFRRRHRALYDNRRVRLNGIVSLGDARHLDCLKDESVDMIVTSPPYLGVNDYVRSMRLNYLFFPEKGTREGMNNEIGARRKRHRKYAYQEYMTDMDRSFSEMARVLKWSGFFCIVIGHGRGRVCKGNVTDKLVGILQNRYKFRIEKRIARKIKFRRIQVPGVRNEEVIILTRELGG